MEPASVHLSVDYEKPNSRGLRRAGRWVWSIVSALTGSPEPFLDLVVRRRETGAEVLRTAADAGDPAYLLDTVTADLESKTVEEFVREWRIVD